MKRILVAALAALSVATPAHAESKWKCPQFQQRKNGLLERGF